MSEQHNRADGRPNEPLDYSAAITEQVVVIRSAAQVALARWDCVPLTATVRLINVSENITFRIDAPGWRSILRVHRPNYHTLEAIYSELAWSRALDQDGVIETPAIYPGADGERVQTVVIPQWQETRQMVMFAFVEGEMPSPSDNLLPMFSQLGEIAAQTHNHVKRWEKPDNFQRFSWDANAVFGYTPVWGRWADAPNLDPQSLRILLRLEQTLQKRLIDFGQAQDQFGLIHADMRLANLLVERNGDGEVTTRLIDFDDCGFGWHLYDFAAAVSFIEDHPLLQAMQSAWLEGYQKHRSLCQQEKDEVATFVMLRRLALLAWIGSHIDAPEPRAMAPHFAAVSAKLGKQYLDRFC